MAWHTHPHGQTIYVTGGVGRAQCRGGPVAVTRPRDRVFFEPGGEHWHGAVVRAVARLRLGAVCLEASGGERR